MKKTIVFLVLIFIFHGANANSCFDDLDAPVQVLRDYYSDLKSNDAKLLFKYFGGKNFVKHMKVIKVLQMIKTNRS